MTEARDLLYSASGPHHHGKRRDAFSATSTPQPKRPPNHTHPIIITIENWSTLISIVNRFSGNGFRKIAAPEKVPRHFKPNFLGLSDKVWIVFLAGNYYTGFYLHCFAISIQQFRKNWLINCMHRNINQELLNLVSALTKRHVDVFCIQSVLRKMRHILRIIE